MKQSLFFFYYPTSFHLKTFFFIFRPLFWMGSKLCTHMRKSRCSRATQITSIDVFIFLIIKWLHFYSQQRKMKSFSANLNILRNASFWLFYFFIKFLNIFLYIIDHPNDIVTQAFLLLLFLVISHIDDHHCAWDKVGEFQVYLFIK